MPSSEMDKSDNRSQLDKFKEAARELETDDDEQRFKDRLRAIAKSTQGTASPPVRPRKSSK